MKFELVSHNKEIEYTETLNAYSSSMLSFTNGLNKSWLVLCIDFTHRAGLLHSWTKGSMAAKEGICSPTCVADC